MTKITDHFQARYEEGNQVLRFLQSDVFYNMNQNIAAQIIELLRSGQIVFLDEERP